MNEFSNFERRVEVLETVLLGSYLLIETQNFSMCFKASLEMPQFNKVVIFPYICLQNRDKFRWETDLETFLRKIKSALLAS